MTAFGAKQTLGRTATNVRYWTKRTWVIEVEI